MLGSRHRVAGPIKSVREMMLAGEMGTGEGRLTPAEQVLRDAIGPISYGLGGFEAPPEDSIAAVEPDDWRLYHLMRGLPSSDRLRILAFAQVLFNLRHTMDETRSTDEDIVTDIR